MRITTDSSIKKILLVFLVIAGLYYAKEFLMPISIGAVIATLFLPFCGWMESKNISRGLSTFICTLIIFVIIGIAGYLVSWEISFFANDFTLIKQKAIERALYLQHYIFDHLGIAIEKQSQILKTEQPSVTSIMQLVIGSVRYIVINFILVLAYIFFLLYYRQHLKQFIIRLTPTH